MAEVAHAIPAVATILEESEIGVVRPGLQVTRFETGPFLSRDWFGYNVAKYNLRIGALGTSAQLSWRTFLHQIAGAGNVAWLVEPVSRTHRGLICGPIADGTRTTFWVPCYSPSAAFYFIDGAPKLTDYNTRSIANLLTEAQAACSDETVWVDTNCTAADATQITLNGDNCIKVTPAGGAIPLIQTSSFTSGVAASSEYTAIAAVFHTNSSAQNFRVRINWYDVSEVSTGTNDSSDVSIDSADGWTFMTVTATAPANTTQAKVRVFRNDASGTSVFYVDCVALCPGDYDRWHRPSRAPALVEFASAPASGSRVTATVTGRRIARVMIDPDRLSWRAMSSGNAYPSNLMAIEAPEF